MKTIPALPDRLAFTHSTGAHVTLDKVADPDDPHRPLWRGTTTGGNREPGAIVGVEGHVRAWLVGATLDPDKAIHSTTASTAS